MADKKKRSRRRRSDLAAKLTAPLRLEDMTAGDRAEVDMLMKEKSKNLRQMMASRKATKAYANDPNLQVGLPMTREAMAQRVYDRAVRSASGSERLPDEPMAGINFYFDHRRALQEGTGFNEDDMEALTSAASRLSPQNPPANERRTAIAMGNAVQSGYVTFTPDLVSKLAQGYVDSAGKTFTVNAQHHLGKTLHFTQIEPEIVDHLRKRDHREASTAVSNGIDWDGLASTGLGSSMTNAFYAIQGNRDYYPDMFSNPKQVGYQRSINEATDDVADEYTLRGMHIGRVARGEEAIGQQTLDITGLQDSNEGMLSNTAPIAGDVWIRAITSGQPLGLAQRVAEVVTPKTRLVRTKQVDETGAPKYVRRGPLAGQGRLGPAAIEHATNQAAVETAAQDLQENLRLPFTVPSRLVQETAWAQARREVGEDPEFNDAQAQSAADAKSQTAAPAPDDDQLALFNLPKPKKKKSDQEVQT